MIFVIRWHCLSEGRDGGAGKVRGESGRGPHSAEVIKGDLGEDADAGDDDTNIVCVIRSSVLGPKSQRFMRKRGLQNGESALLFH